MNFKLALACLAALAVAAPAFAQKLAAAPGAVSPMPPDIPAQFDFPTAKNDWIKRTVMIPKRDGVKL